MELFLTSSVHAVARDIANKVDLSKGNKLAFITTPTEPKEIQGDDLTWLRNDRQALADAGWEVADYTITGKVAEQIEADLTTYNYIYMSGGHTAYLLEQSQRSGFIPVIHRLIKEKGKVYIGTSAGSIVCGPRLPDYFNEDGERLSSQDCYQFVNFTLLPHWGSEDFRSKYFGERLKMAYYEDQVPLLLLTDYQYVHVQNEQCKIIDVNK